MIPIGTLILTLAALGAICALIELARSHLQDLDAWGLLALSAALLLWRLA